ncbi:hypothetical protein ACF0H5_009352 [Mactra antiquata]
MSNRRRNMIQGREKPQLPPIVTEDDGELPFMKQDFFSDVALIVKSNELPSTIVDHQGAKPTTKSQTTSSGKKLYTARCLLAYNSPVFEKALGNAKKHELDLSNKNCDDIVELLCYLDPRVPYTITAQTARQLLPLAEEYEMLKLRRNCENVLHAAFSELRKEYHLGHIPAEINEEYLILADRYNFDTLLSMCTDEYMNCSSQDSCSAKNLMNIETVSERVKLMILKRKLSRLNLALEREKKFRNEAENELDQVSSRKRWSNKFELY